MSETKWTQGPWHVSYNCNGVIDVVARVNGKSLFCTVGYENQASVTADEDARLIAAAPELYEALDAAESILRYSADIATNVGGTKTNMSTRKALTLARNALAKARGETP